LNLQPSAKPVLPAASCFPTTNCRPHALHVYVSPPRTPAASHERRQPGQRTVGQRGGSTFFAAFDCSISPIDTEARRVGRRESKGAATQDKQPPSARAGRRQSPRNNSGMFAVFYLTTKAATGPLGAVAVASLSAVIRRPKSRSIVRASSFADSFRSGPSTCPRHDGQTFGNGAT